MEDVRKSARNGNGSQAMPTVPVLSEITTQLTIEERLLICEQKLARFEQAMFGAAAQLMNNPMMSSILPKEMKTALREALAQQHGTEEKK